jgi:tRNA-dihydrouridine synthase B
VTDQSIKIYLAPFQGITGAVYREIYTRHFPYVDKLFTPFFTNTDSRKNLVRRTSELEKTIHNHIPVIPQVLSNDPNEIINFSRVCFDLGFKEINWNLGCPFPRVARKKRGSGLLMYPELVADILGIIRSELPLRLSVKCRLGYESPDEIFAMMPVFNEFPLSELIIHARIGKQLYKGDIDTDAFIKAREMSDHPVVYNGDILLQKDVDRFTPLVGPVKGWMIGRGLLVDPFLPGDIKRLTIAGQNERKFLIRRFVEDLYYEYRKNMHDSLHAIHIMKELWEYLAFGFDHPKKVFDGIKKTNSFDDYEDAVGKIFKDHAWNGAQSGNFTPELL